MASSDSIRGDRGYLSDEMDLFYPEDLSHGMSAMAGSRGGGMFGPTQEDSQMLGSSSRGRALSEISSSLGFSRNSIPL